MLLAKILHANTCLTNYTPCHLRHVYFCRCSLPRTAAKSHSPADAHGGCEVIGCMMQVLHEATQRVLRSNVPPNQRCKIHKYSHCPTYRIIAKPFRPHDLRANTALLRTSTHLINDSNGISWRVPQRGGDNDIRPELIASHHGTCIDSSSDITSQKSIETKSSGAIEKRISSFNGGET